MAKSKGMSSVSIDNDWQVESDLRTIIDAEKIKRDPKRYQKVQQLAKKRMLEVAEVAAESGED